MTHLGDEDIARLIDNEVSGDERKQMLEHMADCESCLSVYSDTIKFLEEEGGLPGVIPQTPQGSGNMIKMSRRAWLPIAAAILLVIIAYPFLKQILPSNSLSENVIAHHHDRIEAIGSDSGHHFADPNNKEFAAVRIGIWMEDLEGLTKDGKQKENTAKYIDLLIQDLERFLPEGDSLLKEAAGLDKSNFRDVEVKALLSMKNHNLGELYQFGRFIENILLTAIDRELPVIEELSRYQNIATKFQLPQGVLRLLLQLPEASDPDSMVEISDNIIDIFFE